MFITEDFDGSVALVTESPTIEDALDIAMNACSNWWNVSADVEESTVKVYEAKLVAIVRVSTDPVVVLVKEGDE